MAITIPWLHLSSRNDRSSCWFFIFCTLSDGSTIKDIQQTANTVPYPPIFVQLRVSYPPIFVHFRSWTYILEHTRCSVCICVYVQLDTFKYELRTSRCSFHHHQVLPTAIQLSKISSKCIHRTLYWFGHRHT